MSDKEITALQAQVKALEQELARLSGRAQRPASGPLPDYIEHGSAIHAAFLGLRKAEPGEFKENDKDALVLNGWTLQDRTAFGVLVKDEILKSILRQKVNELGGPPPVQGLDPAQPNYAPPIWQPEGAIPQSGMVG